MDPLPLPPHLIEALQIINKRLKVPIPKQDIEKLLSDDWIAVRQPGWALSSKGRALIRKIEPKAVKKNPYQSNNNR